MKANSNRIYRINTLLLSVILLVLNFLAFKAEEDNGIGFLYFGALALIINIIFLIALALVSFLCSKDKMGKQFLTSILYSVLTFVSIQFCFYIILMIFK
jgi:hypothetical protein